MEFYIMRKTLAIMLTILSLAVAPQTFARERDHLVHVYHHHGGGGAAGIIGLVEDAIEICDDLGCFDGGSGGPSYGGGSYSYSPEYYQALAHQRDPDPPRPSDRGMENITIYPSGLTTIRYGEGPAVDYGRSLALAGR